MSIKTKSIYAIGALVFLIAVIATKETSILSIPVAHAESPFDLIEEIQGKGALIIEVLVAATFIIYPIITVLLDPQFFIDILREDDILTIWQLSRDIMNVIFAFMLIGGAMATVVMANQEYLKKYALKFLLGIILVNFSWFFPRVILDVSNVVTANIYQLPSIVGTTCEYREKDGTMSDCKFPSKFLYFPTDDQLNDIRTHTPSSIYNNYQCISDNICYLPQSLVNDTNIPSGILAGLAMNHARIPEMNKVMNSLPTEWERMDANMIQQLISQIIRLGLQFILVMFIALILIGMAVALLVRIPILWITMAFMPLMFISFVLGDLLPTDFNTMQLIFKKFVHAAFLPAVLAVPLSVGFILINGLANSTAPDSAIMLSDSLGPILPGVNDLWEFLGVLVTIVVMWKGFYIRTGNIWYYRYW